MGDHEPTNEEVAASIDRLAELAKKSCRGTRGVDYGRRMEIQRQADMLKTMLNTAPDDLEGE